MSLTELKDTFTGKVVVFDAGTDFSRGYPRLIPSGVARVNDVRAGWGGAGSIHVSLNVLTKDSSTGKEIIVQHTPSQLFESTTKLMLASEAQVKAYKEGCTNYVKQSLVDVITKVPKFESGSDPELFVEDENGEVIPSWLFLPDKTSSIKNSTGYCSAFWDGFQAEYDTYACTCIASFTDIVRSGLLLVNGAAKKHNPKAKLSLSSVLEVPRQYLVEADDKFVNFGCMPSLNVYGVRGEPTGNPRELPIRFAGGHIHLGMAKSLKTDEHYATVVRMLDALLGVPMVAVFRAYDNPARRRFYGLAGEHRRPKHGVEYRVLSNAWLSHPSVMNFTFDLARTIGRLTIACIQADMDVSAFVALNDDRIQHIINNCDVDKAIEFVKEHEDLFTKMFTVMYDGYGGSYKGAAACGSDKCYKQAFRLIYEGLDAIVNNPRDIMGNWQLESGDYLPHGEGAAWRRATEKLETGEKI